MKKHIMIGIKIIVVLFLLSVLFFPLASCSSLKKSKQKSKTEVKSEIKIDSSATENKVEETKIIEETKATEKVVEETNEIEVSDGQELEVTNYDANGKKTGSTKYKGSGKSKKTTSTKNTDATSKKESQSKTDSKLEIDLSKHNSAKSKVSEANLNKEKKGSIFSSCLFWLFLIVISVLLYLNKRFKWLLSIINYLKK